MSNHPVDIVPTVVPRDRDELVEAVRVIAPFSKKIHIDIDDGLFVPQVTWPYVGADMYCPIDLSGMDAVLIEAHLMVRDPKAIGADLSRAGVKTIIGHVETCADIPDTEKMFAQWRNSRNREVGLAILLDTPLEKILPYAPLCDVIQIMSEVNVGAQGAPFDPRAIERVRTLREKFPDLVISVDGGINESNIAALIAAGASRLCIGSAIMRAPDPASAYRQLITALCAV